MNEPLDAAPKGRCADLKVVRISSLIARASMSVEAFTDTNILLYAAAGAFDAPRKHASAWAILKQGRYAISGQVRAEFYLNVQKYKATQVPLKQQEAAEWIERLCPEPVVPVDHVLVQQAIGLSNRYKISYWDAALVAAAETVKAEKLYSEDLNHGQTYGSVKVINPFKVN
jgi:predicted nucleic acid-binding protein